MTEIYINWAARAEIAQGVAERVGLLGDRDEAIRWWHEAKQCWYMAAASCNGNPYELRTRYCEREDIAGQRIQNLINRPLDSSGKRV